MDIFIPFIHENEKNKNNFEQLSLYIDEPIIFEEDFDYQDEDEEETVIILEIM